MTHSCLFIFDTCILNCSCILLSSCTAALFNCLVCSDSVILCRRALTARGLRSILTVSEGVAFSCFNW